MIVPPLLLLLAQVTYNGEIAPIIRRNCVPCHKENGAAPFPLESLSDVRRHATQIAAVTRSRYMPPWLPENDDFAGSRRLTQGEINMIAKWSQSEKEGVVPAHDRDSKAPPSDWELGPPDLILQVPAPYTLPAGGEDVFRNFVIPAPSGGIRYVKAIEFHPGNPKLIHHANVVLDRVRTLRARDGIDGQPGFPGMDIATESGDTFDPDSHFLFWKPGSPPEVEEPGMAWRLDAGTDLILNLHLRPSGKPELIRPAIGLYLAKEPPTRFPMLLQLEHDGSIDIPAGSRTFAVSDQLKLSIAVDLLRIYPHAHYLGKRIEAWAQFPNGTRRDLIDIRDWNLDWQGVFTYRKLIRLPRGTLLSMRITYDNSASNPRNPANPPVRVRSGNRSVDEMGHIGLQVLPVAATEPDPRLALQEAAMKRRLEKYPADFLAHYNLGALLEIEGNHEQAVEQFEAALRVEPDRAAARNAYAAALLAAGRNADALREWRETVRRAPVYVQARYNLARLLAGLDRYGEAISEYRSYLAERPDDPEAHLNLGGLYIALRRYGEALPEFAKACEIDPSNVDALTNYGTLLARTGQLPQAMLQFEAALRIDPTNKTASQNLEKAKSHVH